MKTFVSATFQSDTELINVHTNGERDGIGAFRVVFEGSSELGFAKTDDIEELRALAEIIAEKVDDCPDDIFGIISQMG